MRPSILAGCLISQEGKGILLSPEDSIIADVLTTFGQLVAKGDHAAALKLWQGARGSVDEFLYWHNLGLVESLLGHYPEARLALEKAQLKTIYSSATRAQLESIQEKLPAEGQREAWSDHVNAAFSALGPVKIWLLALLLVVPFVWMIKAHFSRRLLVLSTLGALVPLSVALWFQVSTAAFVTTAPTEVFDGPSKIFRAGRSLAAGTKVMARDRGDWWYVVFPPAAIGWVPKDKKLEAGALWGMP